MQSSFSPTSILATSIAIFTASDEIEALTMLLVDPGWPHHPDTAATLDMACLKAEALDHFTARLAQITASLAEKGLAPEVVLSPSNEKQVPTFRQQLAVTIKPCVCPAYKARRLTEQDIGPVYFAVLIRTKTSSAEVVASTLSNFHGYPDNEFSTRIEAVHPKWQRQGVGTGLFRFVETAVEFIANADPFVRVNLGRDAPCTVIESCIDHNAPKWHHEFMKKLQFDCDGRRGDDLVFQKTISL